MIVVRMGVTSYLVQPLVQADGCDVDFEIE